MQISAGELGATLLVWAEPLVPRKSGGARGGAPPVPQGFYTLIDNFVCKHGSQIYAGIYRKS